jgi:hypothetical protein
MQLDIDLITYLKAHLAGPPPIEQNKIAEDYATNPAIMFIRRPSTQDLLLSGFPSIAETEYDFEIYGIDIDAVNTLADELVAPYTSGGLLNGFQGAMGSTVVLAAFVSDQADDYTPKVELNTDEGLNVVSFALKIMH